MNEPSLAPTKRERRWDRTTARFVRIVGFVDCLALVAVLMPRDVMASISGHLGFAPFSSGPLPEYLARSTSLLYALHGALLLYVANDVARYRGLIRWLGLLAMAHGGIMLLIDIRIGMPAWWCVLEGPTFALVGLVLWLLAKRGSTVDAEN